MKADSMQKANRMKNTNRMKNVNRMMKANQIRNLLCALVLVAVLCVGVLALADGEDYLLRNAGGVVNLPLSVDPTGLQEGFSAVLYDNRNGLPTSEANAITETSDGFIWIGSYAGLIRYDGNVFERMDSTGGLTSIKCLFTDSRDRLWIGTNDNGIAVMEKGRLRKWGKLDGMQSAHTRVITEDPDGIIYIGTADGIMTIDQDDNLSVMRDEQIAHANMRDLRLGKDGVLYGVTDTGDLMKIQDGKLIAFFPLADNPTKGVGAIQPDPEAEGKIYFEAGDFSFYRATFGEELTDLETVDISPLRYVKQMEYIDGKIWICAGNGIGVLENGRFRLLENLPMDNNVGHVMTDYMGNLWFTSTRQGVMKVVPNQFSDLFDRFGLPETVVNATCMADGKLLVGTDTGLIVLDEEGQVSSLPLTRAVTAGGAELEATDLIEMLAGCRIRSIIPDSRGRAWISTWRSHGLIRYDHGEITVFSEEDGLLSNSLRAVREGSDGRILVALTGGANVIEGDRVVASYGRDDGIVNTESLSIEEGLSGEVLIGSNGGGLYIFNEKGLTAINVEEGLPSDIVMRLIRDPKRKVVWIVSSSAIAYMTPDYQIITVQKFPYTNNFDLYENSKGDMWVLSSNGIYVIPAEEMIANGEISPVFYSIASGMPGIATANSYSMLTEEGNLYIAASCGVIKVNIEKPFEDVNDLMVTVPYVEADGTAIYPDASGVFVIPANTMKLTVPSYVFNYILSNPQVSYRLEGFDQHSVTVNRSDMVPVDYTNLGGGTYTYLIQLKDSMGRGNKEVSVQIHKEKKLYEQTFFYIAVGILVIALIAVLVRQYVRFQTRKLKKQQKETMALIGEITEAFAKVIDMKDKYTNGHSIRVAENTRKLAVELGCDEETVEKYYRIALLHDIGKIGVPPEVLNKPGKLTDEEFETIKSHTSLGYEALKQIHIMPELAIGARSHHERPDGKGYPQHLKGEEIPRVAQIIAVADCFDAMYSNRPYRNRMNFDKVVSIIREVSGTQLTPDVVDAFLRLVEKGEFRDPDDDGGGSMENIENIRNKPES